MFAPTTRPCAVRVVLVLDAQLLAEQRRGEAGDVAGGEDVVAAAGAAVLVDDDAVVDRQPGGLGELGRAARSRARRRRRRPRASRPSPARTSPSATPSTVSSGSTSTPLLAVVVGDERGELGREEPPADRRLGEDHRHPAARADERRGDLGADEAAADHDDVRARRRRARAAAGSRRACGSRRRPSAPGSSRGRPPVASSSFS